MQLLQTHTVHPTGASQEPGGASRMEVEVKSLQLTQVTPYNTFTFLQCFHPCESCTPQAAPQKVPGPPEPRDLFDDAKRLSVAWCREVPGLLGKGAENLLADGMLRTTSITCSSPAHGEEGLAWRAGHLSPSQCFFHPGHTSRSATRTPSRVGSCRWVTLIHCSVRRSELPPVLSTCRA